MPAAVTDDLVLGVAGSEWSGWTEVSVTQGAELCPSHFEVSLTEKYPASSQALVVNPGDACTVRLGGDVAVTGYVDKVLSRSSAKGHTVRIVGRGKCQDLVDCSAEWPTGQISGSTAFEIATKLAKPYGITVTMVGDPGASIPQFNLTLTETAWDVIEQICRHAVLLAYENGLGQLVLSRIGTAKAASGFYEGVNLQDIQVLRSADQLFSEYDAFLMSMDVLGDLGEGGNLIGRATDPNVKRHRRRAIIAEAPSGGQDVAQRRALWEAARRSGRSRQVVVVADSWRDSAGALWRPNTLAPIKAPSHHLDEAGWVIGEVTWRRSNESGTTARVTLMPPEAFSVEPILLVPVVAGLQ